MAQQEKGNWKPYSVQKLVKNVELVFKTKDINKLSEYAYHFITQHCGFIAHYSLNGFQDCYKDLRSFARNLQCSEYSHDDMNYNINWANRLEKDKDFNRDYGPVYNQSKADGIRAIVATAKTYEAEMVTEFTAREKRADLRTIQNLADKWGIKITGLPLMDTK